MSGRRRELNIRVALGGRVSQVFALVLRQSTAPVAIGIACGLSGALTMGGVVASLLYEVRPRDPFVLGVVVAIVTFVGIAAAATAALTGIRIEPASALREELITPNSPDSADVPAVSSARLPAPMSHNAVGGLDAAAICSYSSCHPAADGGVFQPAGETTGDGSACRRLRTAG